MSAPHSIACCFADLELHPHNMSEQMIQIAGDLAANSTKGAELLALWQGNMHGKGRGSEGGLSRALQGGRHSGGHGERLGAHGRYAASTTLSNSTLSCYKLLCLSSATHSGSICHLHRVAQPQLAALSSDNIIPAHSITQEADWQVCGAAIHGHV